MTLPSDWILSRRRFIGVSIGAAAASSCAESMAAPLVQPPDLPDAKIVEAYLKAAELNVLAALNDKVFPGYWSVCADGKGHGFGNSYPSLDGRQMADALLWLGRFEPVKKNWDYVRKFQRPDGRLPFAILPASAGKDIGPPQHTAKVDVNGGLYSHWVPGDPLRALAGPTYVQNADAYFRHTQDREWLAAEIKSVNLAADYLAGMVTEAGAVGGGGYYLERPPRLEYDGVAQCYAADAFRMAADLNDRLGDAAAAKRFRDLGDKIIRNFRTDFWLPKENRFAEYIHPKQGKVSHHGLSDTDWAAVAFNAASADQIKVLWPQLLAAEAKFYYGGMPAGIATDPSKYEAWEFTYRDSMDVASMGRVWFLEAAARARMGDADGLLRSLSAVCKVGADSGYYWRERYLADAKGALKGAGVQKYNEYPANLIRIVCRLVLGIEFGLDGSLSLAPVAPGSWWDAGFGHKLHWGARTLRYRFQRGVWEGEASTPDKIRTRVRLHPSAEAAQVEVKVKGVTIPVSTDKGFAIFDMPPSQQPCAIRLSAALKKS